MTEIAWAQLTPDTSYYLHQQYLFKKKKLKGYYVYTIWENDYVKYNTSSEYEFMRLARGIVGE